MKKKNLTKYAIVAVVIIALVATLWIGVIPLMTASHDSGTLLTVTYADGTTKQYDSNGATQGLSLTNAAGSTIASIRTELYITPTWTGTISSYSVSGTMSFSITDTTSGQYVYSSGSQSLQLLSPKPTLVSGQPTVICSSTVTGAQLQGLYSGWVQDRTYKIAYHDLIIPVAITFTDGTTSSRIANPSDATLNIKYKGDSGFTALSAAFNIVQT